MIALITISTQTTPLAQAKRLTIASQSAHAAFTYTAAPAETDQTQAQELYDRCATVVTKTLSALPADHLNTVQRITLTLDPTARRGLGGGTQIVIRCTGMSDMELAAVTVHEVGHTVDATLLAGTSEKTTAFSDGPNVLPADDLSVGFYGLSWLSNSEQTPHSASSDFVSFYASSDPFEDFAESYTAYVLQGQNFASAAQNNPLLQAKYDFLKNIVFDGFAPAFDLSKTELPVRDVTTLPYDLTDFFEAALGH